MTDTTDQQAVTVAQEKLPTRCDGKEQYAFEAWAAAQRYDMDEHPLHYLFLNERTAAARDGWAAGLKYASDIAARLASVSSASAEGFVLVPREITQAMLEAMHRDIRIKVEPSLKTADIMNEREVWAAMLAASPEPVPATNQAGEVETIRAIAAKHIEGWPFDRSRDTLRADVERALLAALATQPATSQEGEARCTCHHRYDPDQMCHTADCALAYAATLSEDLREAIARSAYEASPDSSPLDKHRSVAWDYASEHSRARAYAIADAALAQVKAS